jgi:stage II sporulation protein D
MPRRLPLLALPAAALLAFPAGAAADQQWVVHGAGFGHGVGMSQYGALGAARQGVGYRRILAHYYTGTSLGVLDRKVTVRVLLQQAASASFSGASVAGPLRLDPAATYTAAPAGGGRLAVRDATGRTLGTFRAPLGVAGPGPVRLLGAAENGTSDGAYRGALELRAGGAGGVDVVNALDLETYVRGVVAAESPASWPVAALRAQAVAARTYAITGQVGGDGYDQYADVRSQMYLGVAGEQPSTDAAVTATAGQVVIQRGRPVTTFFFSTSGGRTEANENAWPGSTPRPWLRSVDDDAWDRVSPMHRWTRTFGQAEIEAELRGLVRGRLQRIEVTRRGASPRIVTAQLVGSAGRTTVSGATLSARLELPDSWASFSTRSVRQAPRP